MKLHEMLLAILIVGVIVYGTTFFITDLGSNYGKTADLSSINKTLEHTKSTQTQIDNFKADIDELEIKNLVDVFEVPVDLLIAGWHMTKLTFSQYGTILAINDDLNSGLSAQGVIIPSWASSLFTTFIIIIPVFMLVYGFFKWKFET